MQAMCSRSRKDPIGAPNRHGVTRVTRVGAAGSPGRPHTTMSQTFAIFRLSPHARCGPRGASVSLPLVINDYRLVTSRSMSGVLNFCEAETDLCRLLPQVKGLALASRPRNFVRIVLRDRPRRVTRMRTVEKPGNRASRALLTRDWPNQAGLNQAGRAELRGLPW
jgi:hypothetical protein